VLTLQQLQKQKGEHLWLQVCSLCSEQDLVVFTDSMVNSS
jgi:hypothetical protein